MEKKTAKRPVGPKMIRRLHAIYRACGFDEEMKRHVLLELTDGRTDSTAGLTEREATYLCGFLNGSGGGREDFGERMLRRRRSGALRRMQQYGIDTTDWDRVNAFCLDRRIAGKPFFRLDGEELQGLIRKMEILIKKKEE